jgi:hypothetical protein
MALCIVSGIAGLIGSFWWADMAGGLSTRWDVNGNVTSEETYKDGELVK